MILFGSNDLVGGVDTEDLSHLFRHTAVRIRLLAGNRSIIVTKRLSPLKPRIKMLERCGRSKLGFDTAADKHQFSLNTDPVSEGGQSRVRGLTRSLIGQCVIRIGARSAALRLLPADCLAAPQNRRGLRL